MNFKNVNDLAKYINQQVLPKTLKEDVGEKLVRPKMKENIQSEVYDVYEEPVIYKRLRENGGLMDDANIIVEMIDNNTVSIESHRMDDNRNVSVIVETGVGYNEDWSFPYTHKGRPFVETTRDELRNDGSVEHAIVKGLKRLGINTRK
jgi:hypothetical protein